MSDMESIHMGKLSAWVHESGRFLETLEIYSCRVRDLQRTTAGRCGDLAHSTTAPQEAVDLAIEMIELRADGEDVYDSLKDWPAAGILGPGFTGSIRVSSGQVGIALGFDFGPDIGDLPEEERATYRRLREDGVGAWQAMILAGEPDPEATMERVVEMMEAGGQPADDHGSRPDIAHPLLFPPGSIGTGRSWNRGDALFAVHEHGTLTHNKAGELHAEHVQNSGPSPGQSYVERLGDDVGSTPSFASSFYGQLTAEDVRRVSAWASNPSQDDEVLREFADGFAHATHSGSLSFSGADLIGTHRNPWVPSQLLLASRVPIEAEFLVSATGAALPFRPRTEKDYNRQVRSELLKRVADQGLAAELVLALDDEGELMQLLRPESPHVGRGVIEVLRQAGEDRQAATAAIDAVYEASESHGGRTLWQGRDEWGQAWAPLEAEGFSWLVAAAAPHYNNENAFVGDDSRESEYLAVVEQVFWSGEGEIIYDAAWGRLYAAMADPVSPIGGDFDTVTNHTDAADWLGQMELIREHVYDQDAGLADQVVVNRQRAYATAGITATAIGAILAPEPISTVGGVLILVGVAAGGASLIDGDTGHSARWLERSRYETSTFRERVHAAAAQGIIERGGVEHNGSPVVVQAVTAEVDGVEVVILEVVDESGKPVEVLEDGNLVSLNLADPKHREQLDVDGGASLDEETVEVARIPAPIAAEQVNDYYEQQQASDD